MTDFSDKLLIKPGCAVENIEITNDEESKLNFYITTLSEKPYLNIDCLMPKNDSVGFIYLSKNLAEEFLAALKILIDSMKD